MQNRRAAARGPGAKIRRPHIQITLYDDLFDRAVTCHLDPNWQVTQYWGKRIAVTGLVYRDPQSDRPYKIRDVITIDILHPPPATTGGLVGQSPGNRVTNRPKPASGGYAMNRTKADYTYWDASVFLAYLNNEPNRADIIETLLDQAARSRTLHLVTSALTIVEVVTAANTARPQRLTSTQEERIDNLLTAPYLRLVDTSVALYYDARRLMRSALEESWSLKAKDTIHLATAY